METKRRVGAVKAAAGARRKEERAARDEAGAERARRMIDRLSGAKQKHAERNILAVHRTIWAETWAATQREHDELRRKASQLQGQIPTATAVAQLPPMGNTPRSMSFTDCLALTEALRAAHESGDQSAVDEAIQEVREALVVHEIEAEKLASEAESLSKEARRLEKSLDGVPGIGEIPVSVEPLAEVDDSCEPEVKELRERLSEQISVFDEDRAAEYSELCDSWAAECEESFHVDPTDSCGGWNEDDWFRFDCVVRSYERLLKPRVVVLERLSLEFPGRSNDDVKAHYEWSARSKYVRKTKKALEEAWQRERAQITAAANGLISAAKRDIEEKTVVVVSAASGERKRDALHKKLNEMKEAAAVEDASRKEAEERQREERAKEEARLSALKECEQKAKRAIAAARRAEVKMEKAEIAERDQQAAERQRQETLQQAAAASSKVQARRQRHDAEAAARKIDRMKKEQLAEEHRRRVEEAAEALAPRVAQDSGRVLKQTESVARRGNGKGRRGDGDGTGNFSYKEEEIMGDARTRITEALRNAGMLGTDYAQQCILSMSRPRPDALTSYERAGET